MIKIHVCWINVEINANHVFPLLHNFLQTILFHLCKADDNKNLFKTEQSNIQEEEIVKENGKARESFDDDSLNGEERVNSEKEIIRNT